MEKTLEMIHKQLELLDADELNVIFDQVSKFAGEKERRFYSLVNDLRVSLERLHNEFPNSNVFLTITPEEKIDIMDFIIPIDFEKTCILKM